MRDLQDDGQDAERQVSAEQPVRKVRRRRVLGALVRTFGRLRRIAGKRQQARSEVA